MDFILQNISGILQFGFLGVSFLFVYLGYSNVQSVLARDNPDAEAVDLAKFFMKTALVFMVFAGPLQWISAGLDNYWKNRPVEVTVVMNHPSWEKAFGDIRIYERGVPHSLVSKPYTAMLKNEAEINLNAESVAEKFRIIRQQLAALSRRQITPSAPAPTVGPPPADFDLQQLDGEI